MDGWDGMGWKGVTLSGYLQILNDVGREGILILYVGWMDVKV